MNENTILILPRNYDTKEATYIYENSLYTIHKILLTAGVPNKFLEDKPIEVIELRAENIFLPILYITYQIVIENKEVYELAIDVIKDYLLKINPFANGEKKVKFSIHVEKNKNKEVKKIDYEGPIEGLAELKQAICRIADE